MLNLDAIRLPDERPADPYLPYAEVDLSDVPEPDTDKGAEIELDDGSVVIRIGPPKVAKKDTKFDSNLALSIDEAELGRIAQDLLRSIENDNESRAEWLETRAQGIKLLGLKIESMRSGAAGGSSPIEGMSQVRHPLLVRAVVNFAAGAMAELLPADGPAKVRNDDPQGTIDSSDLADLLEKDLNHYLTFIDKGYVPDTDNMLFRVAVDGSGFKKVYHDPIKRRPISRAVNAEDLIVSNAATSLHDCGRITHRSFMRPSMMKRMQIVGAYRDIELSDPGYQEKTPVDDEKEKISGIRKNDAWDPRDRDYEVYECYCELDIAGFEHETDGEPDGLAVPYKVAIEKESQKILEVRRNWAEDDDLCMPRTYFVQFPYIRGYGFYGIGLANLLGNMTNGLTAAWRELIDLGMFKNFPGYLVTKGTLRQKTNEIRIPPGSAMEIDTQGKPISQVAMPIPYGSIDAVWAGFLEQMEQTGQQLGGTAEIQVGEGRQDAPVGTTLALIEQAIKPMVAVHKRLHAAQAEELELLVERFREDPESFWRFNKKTQAGWNEARFLQAINNYDIVPQSDPNTASQLQRAMRNSALYMMAKDDPAAFDVTEIRKTCLKGMGFGQPDQFLAKGQAPPPPDPKAIAAQMSAQADMTDAQTRQAEMQIKARSAGADLQNQAQDRQAKLTIAQSQLERERMIQQGELARTAVEQRTQRASDAQGLQAQMIGDAAQRAHEQQIAANEAGQNGFQSQRDRDHEMLMAHLNHQFALQQAAAQPKPTPGQGKQ